VVNRHTRTRHADRDALRAYLADDGKETPDMLRRETYFHYVDCWITRDLDMAGQYHNAIRELVNTGVLRTQ